MNRSKQSPVSNPEKKFFYHNDHLGGVNVITDESGARTQLTEYDPWGKVSRSEGNSDPERRFTGQILDPESGLYYYGARYYDPDLGRFISPDSIVPSVYDPQSHNRYSYVRNNPVKYIDPTGHSFLSAFFGGILKVFSFIAKYAMPVFRLASGVLELMGGNILSGLQSIASSMSSFIKNSQFQFATQVFGFFASAAAASSGGDASGSPSSGGEATADTGGSSGGDAESGGGVVNLGTGVTLSSAANFSEAPPVRVIPGITTNDPYGETTFTFVREAGATASQTTNWSLTAEGYTPWGGGGIIFGQNPNGQYFVTGRVGIGLGGGLSYNPFGQSPGYHPSDIIGIGGFAELGAGAGPLSAGVAGEGGLNMAADTQRGGFSYLYSHVNPEFGLDADIKWRLRAVAAGGIQGTFILW